MVEPGAGTACEERFEGSVTVGWLGVGSNPAPLFSHTFFPHPLQALVLQPFKSGCFFSLPFSDASLL